MSNNLCYIIIINYNSYFNTTNSIKSILESNYSFYHIILVDNGSTDDSLRSMKKKYFNETKVTCIKSDKNEGYASGINLGIKYSVNKKNCKYLWILNNDTIIFNDALEELISAENETDDLKIWGSKILNPDLTIQSLGCRLNKYFMWTNHNYSACRDISYHKSTYKVDYIHGCSIFFNKEIINKVGLFDESYFLFYEDVDFSIKSIENNILLDICDKSKVIHKENSTINEMHYQYYSTVNRLKIAKKYFKNKLIFVYLGIFIELVKNIFLLRFNRNYMILKKIIYEF